MGQLEWEALKRVDWCNTERPHYAIGYLTPHSSRPAARCEVVPRGMRRWERHPLTTFGNHENLPLSDFALLDIPGKIS